MSDSTAGGLDRQHLRTVFTGRVVVAVFAFLTIPLVVGSLDGRLLTPLAYPGYLALMLGSSVGSYLFPNLAIWVFWAPFLLGSYAVAVVSGVGYRRIR
ncbi:hypothetical protein [Haloplanus aerogenes]|uniref:Uncharacterized protein n=1 Tax=Haloplanus aerogenes TaxID=660522 RepID=A0A3M0DSQ7_9EURY|nr:hypothetical protein [Haloplanus aerogenes]AZH26164.1 hypothetical protein DU502_12690 [Haloplanus aerogenes]RMB18383.1 hypothetical protein ATH50_1838 [Haloplanus aerogenes]